MKYLDISFDTTEENIACDEALLQNAEEKDSGPVLRFWESPHYFVVLGRSNPYQTEVHTDICEKEGIPILRRCSGGGTILQGPGCLNYSLILPISNYPIQSISDANSYIMQSNKEALLSLIPHLSVEGYTDLAIKGIKVSGNAQRRSKDYVLFHGTFLYQFDLSLISKYLKMPSKAPDYRKHRTHNDFLQNLNLNAQDIKESLSLKWQASQNGVDIPYDTLHTLCETKYSQNDWNFKH